MSLNANPLPKLIHQLRGLIAVQPHEVNRRDLTCPAHSEVQLEFDLDPRFNNIVTPAKRLPKLTQKTVVQVSRHGQGLRQVV